MKIKNFYFGIVFAYLLLDKDFKELKLQALIEKPSIDQTYVFLPPKTNTPFQGKLNATQSIALDNNNLKPNKSAGLSFPDLVDIINPLHHLPIVGSIYREITGDKIEPIPRITGSSIFFGPLGFFSAAINVFVEEITGKDIQNHISSVFNFKNDTNLDNQNVKKDIDHVTAWAQREINFRRAQANKGETNQIKKAILLNSNETIKLSVNQQNNLPTIEKKAYANLIYQNQIDQNKKTISEPKNKKILDSLA